MKINYTVKDLSWINKFINGKIKINCSSIEEIEVIMSYYPYKEKIPKHLNLFIKTGSPMGVFTRKLFLNSNHKRYKEDSINSIISFGINAQWPKKFQDITEVKASDIINQLKQDKDENKLSNKEG